VLQVIATAIAVLSFAWVAGAAESPPTYNDGTPWVSIATPNPGPQTWALRCPAFDLLYGGARGGGKSIFLILDWLGHAHRCEGKARGLLVRRTRKQLTDILAKMRPILSKVGWTFKESEWTWIGPDGSILTMAYLERDGDAEQYQGWDLSWLGIDEAGNFPNPEPIDKLYATLRLPGVEHRIRLTANPGGAGHQWLKERYVKPAPRFTPFAALDREGQPLSFQRVYIPARLKDNPACNTPEYRSFLAASGPPWLVEAWLNGNWDITPGGGIIDVDLINDAKPPSGIERRVLGCDLAFTEDEANDECALVEVGRWKPGKELPVQYHLLWVDHGHWTIPRAVSRIIEAARVRCLRWVRAEGGPSGQAAEPTIRERQAQGDAPLFDFGLVSHMKDKIAKNASFAAAVGMGLVYADKSAPWWPSFRDECMIFDGKDGKQDNQVDGAGVSFREIDSLPGNEPTPPKPSDAPPRSLAARDTERARIDAAKKRTNEEPRRMWRR